MTVSLASYRVNAGEKPVSSPKQNNMLTAIENAFNAFPPSQLVGYPSDANKYLDGSGNWSSPPPALVADLAFQQFTTSVNILATSEATATTIVIAPAYTFDGTTPCWIEYFHPQTTTIASTDGRIVLFQDGVALTNLTEIIMGSATNSQSRWPVITKRKLTPTAGSHVYSIRGWYSGGNFYCEAGTGTSGQLVPGYIRITR